MTFSRHSQSETQTTQIGVEIVAHIKTIHRAGQPLCLALHATLGMGKSVLVRSMLRTLLADETLDVPSPTFTIVQEYPKPNDLDVPLYHFDLYRLEDAEELIEIGWDDYLNDGICFVEWAQKAQHYLPKSAWHIYIKQDEQHDATRIITCEQIDDA